MPAAWIPRPVRRAFSIRTLGFAAAYTWIFTVYLCCSPQAIDDSYVALFPLFYICSFASTVLVLLVFAVSARHPEFGRFFDRPVVWRAFCFAGASSAMFGTVWLAVAWTQGTLSLAGIFFIGLTTGFGQAALFLPWGRVLADSDHAIEEICGAFLIASLLVCVQAAFSSLAGMLFVAVLPLASAYVLSTRFSPSGGESSHIVNAEASPSGEDDLPDVRETNELLARTCAGALVIGIVMGALRYLTGEDASFNNLYAVSKIAASAICCLVVFFQERREHFEFSRIYRYIILLMGLGIVMHPFFDSGLLPVVVSRVGVSCFEAFMWVVAIGFAKCFRVPPFQSVGLCWASLTGGLCAGAAFGYFFADARLVGLVPAGCLALVSLFVLLLVLTFVLTERDLISLEGWGVFSRRRPEDLPSSQETSVSSMDRARSAMAGRAHELAQKYRLSDREEEVLALLALGRSRSQIKEELYLSLGTVNTHISHLYQKLGVHGKDELLAYFEEHDE